MIVWLIWGLLWSVQPQHGLTVTVLDGDGLPIDGATISREDRFVFARSGPDGEARLIVPPGEPRRLVIDAAGYQRAERALDVPLPDRLRVRLSNAARLVGRLVDDRFEPMAGKIQWSSSDRNHFVEIGDDGRFDLEIEPEVKSELVLTSHVARSARMGVEALGHGEVRDLGDVVLDPGLVVVGGVTTPEGAPAEGAEVWVLRRGVDGPILAWLRDDRALATVEESGRFRLSGLATEPARLVVEAVGAARREVLIRPEANDETIDLGWIRLDAGVEVRVEVSADREPSTVRLDLGGHGRPTDSLVASPDDGVAVFRHVAPGELVVSAHRVSDAGEPIIDCRQRVVVPADVDSFTVECRSEGVRVAGRARIGDRVAAGWLVWHVGEQPEPLGGDVILSRHSSLGALRQELVSQRLPSRSAPLDDTGQFAIELRPGVWDVAWQSGRAGASTPLRVIVPESGLRDVELQFSALSLSGRVIDTDGGGVAGAQVSLSERAAFARTGADGEFSLAVTEPGRVSLVARDRERVSDRHVVVLGMDGQQSPTPLEIVLAEEAVEIPIRAVDPEGAPMPGALVFIETDQGLRLLTTDARGAVAWRPRGSEPKRWRAAVHAGGRWGFSPWRRFDRGDALDLAAVGEGRLLIEAEPWTDLAIEGPDGWDVDLLLGRLGSPARVNDDGRLVVTGLPEGLFRVVGGEHAASVSLTSDTVEVDLGG